LISATTDVKAVSNAYRAMRTSFLAIGLIIAALLAVVFVVDREATLPPIGPSVEQVCVETMQRSTPDLSWVVEGREEKNPSTPEQLPDVGAGQEMLAEFNKRYETAASAIAHPERNAAASRIDSESWAQYRGRASTAAGGASPLTAGNKQEAVA
jgi:hypothetical protein